MPWPKRLVTDLQCLAVQGFRLLVFVFRGEVATLLPDEAQENRHRLMQVAFGLELIAQFLLASSAESVGELGLR